MRVNFSLPMIDEKGLMAGKLASSVISETCGDLWHIRKLPANYRQTGLSAWLQSTELIELASSPPAFGVAGKLSQQQLVRRVSATLKVADRRTVLRSGLFRENSGTQGQA
jgi:hypothetical protein